MLTAIDSNIPKLLTEGGYSFYYFLYKSLKGCVTRRSIYYCGPLSFPLFCPILMLTSILLLKPPFCPGTVSQVFHSELMEVSISSAWYYAVPTVSLLLSVPSPSLLSVYSCSASSYKQHIYNEYLFTRAPSLNSAASYLLTHLLLTQWTWCSALTLAFI